jgi:hypothetical protein
MATKAKLLLRELKGVRTDLTFSRNRCAQVEEENRRLRESIEKGIRHEEDDLVCFPSLKSNVFFHLFPCITLSLRLIVVISDFNHDAKRIALGCFVLLHSLRVDGIIISIFQT